MCSQCVGPHMAGGAQSGCAPANMWFVFTVCVCVCVCWGSVNEVHSALRAFLGCDLCDRACPVCSCGRLMLTCSPALCCTASLEPCTFCRLT